MLVKTAIQICVLAYTTTVRMPKPAGCGEYANRIQDVRRTNDAVPVGHHILGIPDRYFRRMTRSGYCEAKVSGAAFSPLLG